MSHPGKNITAILISLFVVVCCTTCVGLVYYLQIDEVRTAALTGSQSDYSTPSFSLTLHDIYWLKNRPTLIIREGQVGVADRYTLVVNLSITNRGNRVTRFDCVFFDVAAQGWRTQAPFVEEDSLFMLRLSPGEARTGKVEFWPFEQPLQSGQLDCNWRDLQGIALETVEIPLQSK